MMKKNKDENIENKDQDKNKDNCDKNKENNDGFNIEYFENCEKVIGNNL